MQDSFLYKYRKNILYKDCIHINIAVEIKSHVLLKRKARKISLKIHILTKLNKMSTTNRDMVIKKIYVNEDCSKMIKSS